MIKLNEVSQSKKISKYVDASVFIKWYRENKSKVASILKVDEKDLASIDEMLSQSYGLINNVINTQSRGNSSNKTAFQSFVELDKILIHDFLHNLYDISEKDFIKSLSDYEFTIDEIIEEIEILAIEESFMKFMNIRYPKPDFINQNINQLGSYLAGTFIKDHFQDFINILTDKEKPFLYVQGKKMYLEGTPYEGIGEIFKKIPMYPSNMNNNEYDVIEDEDDFKAFLVDLLSISKTIEETGGDRGQFPDGDYYGGPDDYEYYNDEYLSYFVKDGGYGYGSSKWDDYLELIEDKIKEENEDLTQDEIDEYFSGDKTDEDFPGLDFSYDDADNIDKYVTKNDIGKITYIFYEEDTLKPIEASVRELLTYDDSGGLYEYVQDEYNERNDEVYSKYFDEFKTESLSKLLETLYENQDARAIFRRVFRSTDLLRNISSSKQSNADKRYKDRWGNNGNINLVKFFDTPYTSLSKNIVTDNAKKLYLLLLEFRGYIITNLNQIKAQYKENKKVNVDNEFFTFLKKDTKMIETFYYSYKTQGNNFNKYINTIKENRYGIEIKRRPVLNTNYYVIGEYIDFLFEFIPFLEKYYEFVKNTDKDYLSTYSANININIGTVFSDDFIKKIRQLYIVLQGVFAKTKKIKSLEREIEKSLEEIDLASINKRLNQKYGDNIPDSVYDNVFKIIIDSIFTKYYKKPKRIDKEESKYDSLKKYKNAKKLIDIEDWNTIAKFVVFY